jgi:drug/metabolite transporter (DMT)-like permease
MKNLFTAQFWFNQQPGSFIPSTQNIILIIIAIFAAMAVAAYFLSKKKWFYKPLFQKLFSFFVCNAIVFALLDFFAEEYVPFLSARFWILLWAVAMIVWLSFIFAYAKKFPAKKEQLVREQEYKKYLP